ncbi:MAG: site-specific DNA-methyltransferase [Ignavibacteria bacterium]
MTGESLNITKDQIDKLKSVFPEVVTEGKVDWEKLQATLGKENVEFNNERYVLNWAGKSEAFKVLQQSTTATLKPVPDESINFETTENVFIEGENLEVLKVLQKAYYGKVKCIIIDPPYNTGSDSFIYPDSFKESREEYQKRIGEKDEDGYLMKEGFFRKNSKDSGHYHSNWLSMMYPRLFLAKNLLRDDGVIFVHIDDNEVHNLRLIMNEIFGEENFIAEFIWHSRQNVDSRALTGASIDHEYVLCFEKNNGNRIRGKEIDKTKYSNPDSDIRGPWMSSPMDGIATKDKRPNLHYIIVNPISKLEYEPSPENGWRFQRSKVEELINEDRIIWPKNPLSKPRFKRYLNELNNDFTGFSSLLDVDFTSQGTKELRELMEMETLKFPKPTSIVKTLINQAANNDDIILDFFAGSATTAQAVLELNKEEGGNRKFILVQLPELCNEESDAYKAGYKTISDIGKERIRRVIQKIEKEDRPELFEKGKRDLGFKVFKLSSSNFKIWRGNEITEDNLETQLDAFANPVKEGSETESMLYELLLKSGYLLTDKVQKISSNGKNPQTEYYSINVGELIIALDKITQKLIDKIISAKPKKVITLDKLFTGNDQLKTNTVLQMKDVEIDFKTI